MSLSFFWRWGRGNRSSLWFSLSTFCSHCSLYEGPSRKHMPIRHTQSTLKSSLLQLAFLSIPMDSELKENLLAAGDAKLCGGMHSILSGIVSKVSEILPVLEAIRPGSKSGIQALCALHVTLDKAKNILQQCSSGSKFYLTVTGASMVLKFERVKYALLESLRGVEEIAPQVVACQILVIVGELKEATFTLDQSEKEAGDELIKLIQKENKCNGDQNEREKLEIFYQAAVKLGITSSVAALTERRALKKLVEEARVEQDEEKESTAAYLFHLMRNFSNSFVNEMSGGIDFQGSAPCTRTSKGNFSPRGNIYPLEEKLSRHCSLPSKPTETKPGNTPVPPEEFRCPISLQLMYDPVIISSGHTYERFFIEKWFNDGHNTCPKTQQQLCHLSLTPNYCVKGLIATWCEQYGLPFPAGLPDSPDGSDDRALSENDVSVSEFTFPCEVDRALSENDVRASECSCPCEVKDVEVSLLEDRGHGNHKETIDYICSEDYKVDRFERQGELINLLNDGKSIREQQVVVERIRFLLKDNNEARIYMGTNGLTEALLRFLRSAIQDKDKEAQEMGAMALFNLAVNNNRNKEMIMLAGVIPLLEDMSSNSSNEAAAALYFNLSCLDDAKPVIGSSKAVPFLIQLLHAGDDKSQCKGDALHTLYNLSTHPPIIPHLLSAGIVDALHFLITAQAVEGPSFEKPLAILTNLSSVQPGRSEIMSCPGMLSAIAALLDIGSLSEQEQAASCLLILCDGNQECSHMVLQEGVIPLLVLCSINGTATCKEKAQKLLSLFRGQRQRGPSPSRSQQQLPETSPFFQATMEMKQPSIRKAASKRLGRTITAMLKNKYSLRQG